MSGGWHEPPALAVISGSEEFQRLRELRKAERAASATGREIVRVDVGEGIVLRQALSAAGFLFDQPLMILVQGAAEGRADEEESEKSAWTDADVALLVSHASEGDARESAIVVHHPGEVKAKSFAGRILEAEYARKKKPLHLQFKAPARSKEVEHAAGFLVRELKERHGKVLDADVAMAVVRRVGPDLGQLSFEALKMARYLDATGGREKVEVTDVRETLARLGDDDWRPILDALAAADGARVSRALADLRDGPVGTRGAAGCCKVLGSNVVRWYHAGVLAASGASPEEAGTRMKVSAWAFSNLHLPPSKRWGVDRLRALLRRIVEVERGAKGGHLAPWISLESALILACLDAGYRPNPGVR